jgi:periplasmic protein TonB
MRRMKVFRQERSAIAAAVLLAHVAAAWLFWLAGQARMDFDTPVLADLIYITKVEVPPRPLTPGNPDPEFRLVPLTSPQPQVPAPSVIPIDTLEAPIPGPDPAPSTAVEISLPGPVKAGESGFPGIGETRGLKVLKRVVPRYPVEAGRRGEEGTTFLLVHVDAKGRPGEMRLARSSGFRRLDDAATLAARKWIFEPHVKDGKPVDSWTLLEMRFNLARYSYSRIEVDARGTPDEMVRMGEADIGPPGGEAALLRFFQALAAGSLPDAPVALAQKESGTLRLAFMDWGEVKSIRFMQRAAGTDTSFQRIRPEYQVGRASNQVAVQWGMYEVRQEQKTSVWRIAIDGSGEIWSAHAGVAPWSK